MPELTVRPTAKLLKAGAIALAAAALALEILYLINRGDQWPYWPMLVPPLLMLWPAVRLLRRRFTSMVIAGDRLRYESGIASRSTRSIQLSRVQDIRVDQTLTQRILGVGDIAIETAGETSRLIVRNIDRPQELADQIMNMSQRTTGS